MLIILDGGDDDAVAMGCSGGRRDPRCFSSRLMWRPGGEGELYTYLPSYSDPLYKANEIQCSLSNSTCNPQYGASLMRGSFTFTPGQWKTVAQRLKLNTVGNANGELELFVDGQSTIKATGLILTGSNLGRIRGLFMQSFFGGESMVWNYVVNLLVDREFMRTLNRFDPGLGDAEGSRCILCGLVCCDSENCWCLNGIAEW